MRVSIPLPAVGVLGTLTQILPSNKNRVRLRFCWFHSTGLTGCDLYVGTSIATAVPIAILQANSTTVIDFDVRDFGDMVQHQIFALGTAVGGFLTILETIEGPA